MQNIHNHACSRTLHVLHTRVVTSGGKHIGILILNKRTFKEILEFYNGILVFGQLRMLVELLGAGWSEVQQDVLVGLSMFP